MNMYNFGLKKYTFQYSSSKGVGTFSWQNHTCSGTSKFLSISSKNFLSVKNKSLRPQWYSRFGLSRKWSHDYWPLGSDRLKIKSSCTLKIWRPHTQVQRCRQTEALKKSLLRKQSTNPRAHDTMITHLNSPLKNISTNSFFGQIPPCFWSCHFNGYLSTQNSCHKNYCSVLS